MDAQGPNNAQGPNTAHGPEKILSELDSAAKTSQLSKRSVDDSSHMESNKRQKQREQCNPATNLFYSDQQPTDPDVDHDEDAAPVKGFSATDYLTVPVDDDTFGCDSDQKEPDQLSLSDFINANGRIASYRSALICPGSEFMKLSIMDPLYFMNPAVDKDVFARDLTLIENLHGSGVLESQFAANVAIDCFIMTCSMNQAASDPPKSASKDAGKTACDRNPLQVFLDNPLLSMALFFRLQRLNPEYLCDVGHFRDHFLRRATYLLKTSRLF